MARRDLNHSVVFLTGEHNASKKLAEAIGNYLNQAQYKALVIGTGTILNEWGPRQAGSLGRAAQGCTHSRFSIRCSLINRLTDAWIKSTIQNEKEFALIHGAPRTPEQARFFAGFHPIFFEVIPATRRIDQEKYHSATAREIRTFGACKPGHFKQVQVIEDVELLVPKLTDDILSCFGYKKDPNKQMVSAKVLATA